MAQQVGEAGLKDRQLTSGRTPCWLFTVGGADQSKSNAALRPGHEKQRQQTLVLQNLVAQNGFRDAGLDHEVQSPTPVTIGGLGRSGPGAVQRRGVPELGQPRRGLELMVLPHAVPAKNCPPSQAKIAMEGSPSSKWRSGPSNVMSDKRLRGTTGGHRRQWRWHVIDLGPARACLHGITGARLVGGLRNVKFLALFEIAGGALFLPKVDHGCRKPL